jgi:putative Mn2+ efflux pump MntP
LLEKAGRASKGKASRGGNSTISPSVGVGTGIDYVGVGVGIDRVGVGVDVGIDRVGVGVGVGIGRVGAGIGRVETGSITTIEGISLVL